LHLEVKRHRMERDFRLNVRVGKPRVSYRETLRSPIQTVGEFSRQSAGTGLFGRLTVSFANAASDPPVTVSNKLPPGKLPPLLMAAAERGLRDALQSGGEFGYPVLNVQATIVDAAYEEQLSNEVAFVAAAADAVRQAFKDNVVLLEPIMHVEVATPEESLGPITADLNARRSEILQLGPRGKWWVVEALAPLAKLFDYADKLRSLSQGRASSTMEPHSYRPAPDDVLASFYDGTSY
jgi:elongation factor G